MAALLGGDGGAIPRGRRATIRQKSLDSWIGTQPKRPEKVCSVRPRTGIYIVRAGIGRFIRLYGVKAQGRSMFKVQGSTFQLGTGQPTKKEE